MRASALSLMVFLFAFSGAGVAAASPTSAVECDLVQATMSSVLPEAAGDGPVYPALVQPGQGARWSLWPSLDLLLAGFDLTMPERVALVAAMPEGEPPPFVPECAWKGQPLRLSPEGAEVASVFSRPIVTADGRLAALAWTRISPQGRYMGGPCLARLVDGRWRVKCLPSWLGSARAPA